MNEHPWLEEMMHAALEDPAETQREPDFGFSGINEETLPRQIRPGRNYRRWMLPAAAALVAASLATPLGIISGRRQEERRIDREIQELFVDGLIGESLFDEGLVTGTEWFFDIDVAEDFFEI
jgi:hypothetical protein